MDEVIGSFRRHLVLGLKHKEYIMKFWRILAVLVLGVIVVGCDDTTQPPSEPSGDGLIPIQVSLTGLKKHKVKAPKITFAEFKGEHPGQFRELPKKGLKPGKYLLKIESEGYKPLEKKISLEGSLKKLKLAEKLEPLTRKIILKSKQKPDMVSIGKITVSDTEVEMLPGRYQLKAKRKGYREINREITLDAGNNPYTIELDFEALPRKLKFDGNIKAKITIDGKLYQEGQPLAPGKYRLQAESKGYRTLTKDIVITPGSEDFKIQYKLIPIACKLQLKVSLDHPARGNAPEQILIDGKPHESSILPGAYRLEVRKPGYHTIQQDLKIDLGTRSKQIEISLKAKARDLQLTLVNPENKPLSPGFIKIDGKKQSSKKIQLLPGKYNLTAGTKGYQPRTHTFEVVPGEDPIALKIELKKAKPVFRQVRFKFDVSPDELLLDGKKIRPSELKLQVGEHKLVARKAGYHTIEKELEVVTEQGSNDFTLKFEPHSRALKLKFDYDVMATGATTPQVKINDKSGELSLKPGTHKLFVSCPGYAPITKELQVVPGEGPVTEKITLKALPRKIQWQIQDHTGAVTKPDKFLFNGQPQQPDTLKPGRYEVTLTKKGFHKLQQKIFIPVGEGKYDCSLMLRPIMVKLFLQFRRGGSRTLVQPRTLLDGQNYHYGLEVAGGIHKVKAQMSGYQTLETEIVVPTDREEYKKQFVIQPRATKCIIEFEVVSPFPGPGLQKVTPDLITLNGNAIRYGQSVTPGRYKMIIRRFGYQTIEKNVTIPMDEARYKIKQVLQPNPCKLVFRINADYPIGIIEPDKILIDDKPYTGEIYPGTYQIKVYKAGYKAIEKRFFVDIGTNKKIFVDFMRVLPRKLDLDFVDRKTNKKLDIKKVLINGREYKTDGKIALRPGKHIIEIKDKKAEAHSQKIKVEPGDIPLELKIELTKILTPEERMRLVKFDFNVTPDEIRIGKKIVKGNQIKIMPGRYTLEVAKKNYQTFRKEIMVTEKEEPYLVEATLELQKRELSFKVTADHRRGLIRPDKVVVDGKPYKDHVTVGSHKITIHKAGYTPISKEIKVEAGKTPYQCTAFMRVLNRKLIFKTIDSTNGKTVQIKNMTFDEKPFDHTKKLEVRPAEYPYTIEAENYCKYAGVIQVKPGDTPLTIEVKMVPTHVGVQDKGGQPLILQSMHPQTNELIKPLGVLVNGKTMKPGTLFKVGEKIDIAVQYPNYATYRTTIVVKPGDGIEVPVKLVPLKKYVFQSSKTGILCDGIKYPYTFWLGGKQVDDHLVTVFKSGYRNLFTVSLPFSAKKVKIMAGYEYKMKPLLQQRQRVGYLAQIDVDSLIEHLQKVRKSSDTGRVLFILENIVMRKFSTLRRNLNEEEKTRLIEYAATLEFKNIHSVKRHEALMSNLERLLN